MADTHRLTVIVQACSEIQAAADGALLFQAGRVLMFNLVKRAGVPQAAVEAIRPDAYLQVAAVNRGVGFDPKLLRPGGSGGSACGAFANAWSTSAGALRFQHSRPEQSVHAPAPPPAVVCAPRWGLPSRHHPVACP